MVYGLDLLQILITHIVITGEHQYFALRFDLLLDALGPFLLLFFTVLVFNLLSLLFAGVVFQL